MTRRRRWLAFLLPAVALAGVATRRGQAPVLGELLAGVRLGDARLGVLDRSADRLAVEAGNGRSDPP